MKRILTLAFMGILSIVSHNSFATIYGPASGCVGSTNYFTDSAGVSGGTWSSSNTAVATITAGGMITAVSAGTTTISYVAGSFIETQVYTASPLPSAIAGVSSFCAGTTTPFTSATGGGAWSISPTSVATINAATGVATGVSTGLATVYYMVGGCSVSHVVTVNGTTTPDSITGPSSVCIGSTIALADVTPGGTWSSSSANATVSSTGVVTGVSAGMAWITYTVTGICSTSASTVHYVSVVSSTSAGSITGTTTLAAGGTTTLSGSVSGGTWSSSNTAVATINTSGVVSGVAAGTSTITYTVSGACGSAYTTAVITVTPFDGIAGQVLFTGTSYYGGVKVWLITYNAGTSMLAATDSLVVYSSGSSATYQFTGVPTGSYRVKAATQDSMMLTTGYIPTYHTSSFYWSAATVIAHTSGTSDLGKNITMGYGTTTSGPGFIAGDVTMGANKGTAGTIPAVGMLMYVENNTTGAIMQKTTTDAAGHYSFSNLPVGTYKIYPELINYATTPFTSINITATSPSMTAASFEQHTISHTITPAVTAIAGVNEQASFINAFPNPTSGILNINYNIAAAEQATVTIADVTGRQVYNTTIDLNKGAGASQVDLSALANGIYMITVSSASVNYNNKIQVQK